jgi:hypothetical protein
MGRVGDCAYYFPFNQKKESMKSISMKFSSLCLLFLFTVGIAGCGDKEQNPLATDGATAEDFAKYEKELAAVSGGESYEDAEDVDNATE